MNRRRFQRVRIQSNVVVMRYGYDVANAMDIVVKHKHGMLPRNQMPPFGLPLHPDVDHPL